MLYLNAKIMLETPAAFDLTLTSVVFELLSELHFLPIRPNLTLTSVVFEFSGNVVFYIHLKNLTLTSVVFEYSFSTEIKWDAVI